MPISTIQDMSDAQVAHRVKKQGLAAPLPLEMHSFKTLKEGLSFLLTRYVRHQNKAVAAEIVKQLEVILAHHDCADFPKDRCAFYRLIRHWRAKCI